ncbi:hypothetical protein [Microvirga sp. VF16]|uniref:hypothetical protein n=1 Tax=Microvirga sp. VF16 TaxID=2807101 RepID=UPI00193DDDB7|nr:hypothetical protein [Microvirga sp. VF16]QRM34937.1 hypothetical protein JO965_42515 [Microvirga sp. VF16]
MSGFIIEATITGPQATLGEFRTQFLDSFPVIRKDSSEEIIVTLSGGDLDPRPTLLNLSGEFSALTFSVVEYAAHLGIDQASHCWIAQDGEMRPGQ